MYLIIGEGVTLEDLPNSTVVDYKIVGYTSTDIQKASALARSPKVDAVYIHYDMDGTKFSAEVETKAVYYSTLSELRNYLGDSNENIVMEKETVTEIEIKPVKVEHTDVQTVQNELAQVDNIEPLNTEELRENVNQQPEPKESINMTPNQEGVPTTESLIIMSEDEENKKNLEDRDKEITNLKRQLKTGIEEVVESYKNKITRIEQNHEMVLKEANERLRSLSDRVNELANQQANDIVALYGGTPQAKTIKRKTYNLPPNTLFITKGLGISNRSLLKELQGLFNNEHSPVVIDLTCNKALSYHFKLTTEYNSITLEKFAHYNHPQKWGRAYVYPSIYANELALLEYNFTKVLTEVSEVAKGYPLVVLLPSFEGTTTRTLLQDLITSGAKGIVLSDNDSINIMTTCHMYNFLDIPRGSLELYVTSVTEAITPLLEKATSLLPIKAFEDTVVWTKSGFFSLNKA